MTDTVSPQPATTAQIATGDFKVNMDRPITPDMRSDTFGGLLEAAAAVQTTTIPARPAMVLTP